MTPAEIVTAFWTDMGSNDFALATRWFSDDFTLHWPQSGEMIYGREDFAALNSAYPAAGPWRFHINLLTGDGAVMVSDVSVTDGEVKARAVTFHWIAGGKITRQVEYWPDAYDPPEWRRQWVTLTPDQG